MSTPASPDDRLHGFLSDGKSWEVERYISPQSRQSGLRFRLGDTTRFLGLSRGTVPTDRELNAITDDVLRVLLRRAQPQRDNAVRAGTDT